ncbi:MAG TPA: PLP-dependent aminotransferase family protein [Bryobacteraceae bacterium]|nr:PLP-dependent aminotransferase family protein [Bryobacteraceae bacterium]
MSAALPMIAIDRRNPKPLHRQIYDSIRGMIFDRSLRPGEQIPASRALAGELGISRIPVLGAYAQLLAEGYLESRAGAGTFVAGSLALAEPKIRREPSPNREPPIVSKAAQGLPTRPVPWLREPGPFSVGQLAYDHFPFHAWSRVLTRHARRVRVKSLNYPSRAGLEELREALALYLRASRAVQCDAAQIVIVSGSQQALALAGRTLLDAGSPAWVEEPGYPFLRNALSLTGCRTVPVPVDGEGLDVAAGIKLCREARAAFVTPSHQFPLGVTMSAARRLQLLEWAHGAGAWIVEDDYDSEYRYESMPVASLQGLDGGSRVIYIGTFSKTLFPSLRVGYAVVPQDLIDPYMAVRHASDLGPPYLYQAALADFLGEGHFARHVRKTRQLYAERRSALVEALRAEFGPEFEILGAEAGMHLVMTLPRGLSDVRIATRAVDARLWLWPLSTAYAGKGRQGFILGFGSTRVEDMAPAVRHLRQLVDSESGYTRTNGVVIDRAGGRTYDGRKGS